MRWDYPPLDINPVFPGLGGIIIIIIFIIIVIIIIIIIIIIIKKSPAKNNQRTTHPTPWIVASIPPPRWIKNGMAHCLCESSVSCYALTLSLLSEPEQLLAGVAGEIKKMA